MPRTPHTPAARRLSCLFRRGREALRGATKCALKGGGTGRVRPCARLQNTRSRAHYARAASSGRAQQTTTHASVCVRTMPRGARARRSARQTKSEAGGGARVVIIIINQGGLKRRRRVHKWLGESKRAEAVERTKRGGGVSRPHADSPRYHAKLVAALACASAIHAL